MTSTCDHAVVTQPAPYCLPTSPQTYVPRESFRACAVMISPPPREALGRIGVNLFVTAYSEYEVDQPVGRCEFSF
jgi:hypothetical protein